MSAKLPCSNCGQNKAMYCPSCTKTKPPADDSCSSALLSALESKMKHFEEKHGHDAEIILQSDGSGAIEGMYGNSEQFDDLFQFLADNDQDQ